jgi:hypothetical protein
MVLCVILLRFYLVRQNRKRDEMLRQNGTLVDPNLVHAFDDRTDQENLNFRYIY